MRISTVMYVCSGCQRNCYPSDRFRVLPDGSRICYNCCDAAARLTREELEQIESRANAATPGPWGMAENDQVETDEQNHSVVSEHYHDEVPLICTGTRSWPLILEDAVFIAHAREDIPRLIDTIRKLRETCDWELKAT